MDNEKRNLNPHKAARLAMFVMGEEYAAQNGGSMDFWDSLSGYDKFLYRQAVERIINSPDENITKP